MIVGLAERQGLDDGAAGRVVALYQEHSLGPRVHAVRAGQELGAGHLAHLVADDEHGHRDVLIGQLAKHRQSRGGRRGTDNPEILAEPPAEIVPQGPHDPGVIIDREQDRM